MPYLKVWLHLVWSTKERFPFLRKQIRNTVFDHIRTNAKKKGIYLDSVNGHIDHIHCLVSLSNNQTISNLVKLIKGESSHWINQQRLCDPAFEWQDEYFAASVSHSQLQRVRNYINNQERHHQKKTFREEWEKMIERYGLEEITSRPAKKTI